MTLGTGWAIAPAVAAAFAGIQWLVWMPEWLWLAIGIPLIPALALLDRGGGATGASVFRWVTVSAILLAIGWGVERREWSIGPSRSPLGKTARVLFLSAQDPPRGESGTVLDAILEADADLVVIANPGWLGPLWRSRIDDGDVGPWSIRWFHPILVASREGDARIRTVKREGDVVAMRVEIEDEMIRRAGVRQLLVVDLPSSPDVDRASVLRALAEAVADGGGGGGGAPPLVLGDLNLTPRTRGIDQVVPGLEDLFPRAGVGWGATWPRRSPVLRIDFALGGDRLDVVGLRTFDPGFGGHRGLLLDLGAGQAASSES